MPAILILLLLAQAPHYSRESLVHGASGTNAPLAPNTIGVLYGQHLSFPLTVSTLTVLINRRPARILYASSQQVNFWIPGDLPIREENSFTLVREGVSGPTLTIPMAEESPELFQVPTGYAAATRPDGSLVSPESPASAGEIVVIYGSGFGPALGRSDANPQPTQADRIRRMAAFEVRLGDRTVPREDVTYVGVTPGFAGLYQVNLRLPEVAEANPPIRIGLGGITSIEGVRLAMKPGP